MRKTKVILLDIPWDSQYGQRIRLGIYRYARPRRLWMFINVGSYGRDNPWLKRSETVGVISMQRPQVFAEAVRSRDLSVVCIGDKAPKSVFSDFAYVNVNPKAMGEMAADYFIQRGFRNFGLITSYSPDNISPFLHRGESFIRAAKRKKLTYSVFDPQKKYPLSGEPLPAFAENVERVRRWLASLPKPLALFAVDDSLGMWVCEVCWYAEMHVPEEVAVLGADDDEVFCGMANPHLSSIQVPDEQVGYEAAKLLDAMLLHNGRAGRSVLLSPMGVVTRQSTDVMAITDHYVTRAVRYIRENAHKGIRVEHVIEEVRMSRRTLEQRFQASLNRSPFSEIRRVQIERVKTLLAQTDLTHEAIAPECGFSSVTRMAPAFKKATGMTLGGYRRQFRSR